MNVETLQIHLNSENADSYNNNNLSDCVFHLPNIELHEYQNHTIMLSVQYCAIPYTFYNIDSINNTLIYTQNGIQSRLNITCGNYNAINLAAYLTSNLTNISVKYNTISNKFVFTNTSFDFSFSINSTCFSLLGISKTNLNSINKGYTSPNCINLLSKTCLCIQSNIPTLNINHSNLSEGNIIISFPINKPPYSLITFENKSNFKTVLKSNTISNINIKLIDQNDNLVDLNGCFFTITLQIDIIDLGN
jgi:hypothetical protein